MAISANTPIPTLAGWILAKDLKTTDLLFGRDGNPKKIKSIQSYVPQKMYRIGLMDGLGIKCDKNLALETEDIIFRNSAFDKRKTVKLGKSLRNTDFVHRKVMMVEQLQEVGLIDHVRKRSAFSIPTTDPVNYRWEDHPVPPFIVGVWMLTKRTKGLFKKPPDFDKLEEKVKEYGYQVRSRGKNHFDFVQNINQSFLARYGTIPTIIPEEYYYGAGEQRIELLRGIIWSKPHWYYPEKNKYAIGMRDRKFLKKIQQLCESVGIKTNFKSNKSTKSYELRFKTDLNLRPDSVESTWPTTHKWRFITSIEEIQPTECVHIVVDGSYIIGEGFIPVC